MPEVRGLVLAAGLGARMRPLTDYMPKPLLPVDGVTLLDRAIDALDRAGAGRIAVNAHHRADRIAAHLAARPDAARFHLSVEPRILGTGGALDGVRAFLAEAPTFLVHNGDVLSDLDCAALLAAHRDRRRRARGRALATLALADWPEVNSVLLGRGGRVRDIAGRLEAHSQPRHGDRNLTFTGIACYDRAFLDLVPPRSGSLIDLLVRLLREEPGAVRGWVHRGVWEDLGTLERYLDAHRRMLGPGFVSIVGSAAVPPTARLDECVVLDGAAVAPGTELRRAVLGRGWAVNERSAGTPGLSLASAAGFDLDNPATVHWIGGHGSDRLFARLAQGRRRVVLMQPPPDDPDVERGLAIATFLYDSGLGAPAVLARDPGTGAVLFEDLGEDTLCELVARDRALAGVLYGRVLDRLADLQTFGVESRHRCPSAWDRVFDADHLRWETDYFRRRFLIGHAGLRARDLVDLDGEFEGLAAACLGQPYTLVHRDFQSQNILFKDDVVRLVDVQGMRWGPIAYDAASLLFDPYVDLPWPQRLQLLATFPRRLAERGGATIKRQDWMAMCLSAGLQRLMQALGAYGYLGHVKRKPVFLSHIPAALDGLHRLLRLAVEHRGSPMEPPCMPCLADVAASLTKEPPDGGR
jgi:NDP-sugar pyrophosphorylase family protein/aminoglycoside/choline kinase family phosphotransferase